jgi:hypothetical protein
MNPLRTAPFALAAALLCCLTVAACSRQPAPAAAAPESAAAPQGPGSLAGIWLNNEYKASSKSPERERVLLTVDGKFPPLQPWAAQLLEKRIKDSEEGLPFASTLALCLPGGIPLMLFGDDVPIQILETPGQVAMLFVEGNRFRVIPLNATHPENIDPSFMGEAVGRWEGDTLVVDTRGFRENTTLDQIGTPHTEQLHVVERYRRTGPESMEIRVTIEDPGTFTAPWEAKVTYRLAPADTRMIENICENNRNPADAQGRSGFQRF